VTDPAPLPHTRAFELLPWLINGTLAGTEREAVEQHVRACIVCRREMKEQQRLHASVRARRTVDVSAEAGFDRLDRELDVSAGVRRPRWQTRYAAATPFALAAAAGVAVLAILLWFTPLPDLNRGGYQTLADAPAGGALVDIVFADKTTAAQMQALLDEIHGDIVAGPTQLGRYSVRIAGDHAKREQVDKVIAALAADPRVRFAGPSLAEVQP
jgi:hypothetical protein